MYNTGHDSQRYSARVASSGPLLRDKGQIDESRKNLYHKMLKKYIDKKEKLSTHRPLDLPTGPSYTSVQSTTNLEKPSRPLTASGQHQPQYLAYLEKTLEKSDQTN